MDVGGGAAAGAQEEVLVPGLAWDMRNHEPFNDSKHFSIVHC